MKKIALLFVIKNKINLPKIWLSFLNSVDPSKYNIYIHYKEDVDIGFFNEFKISNCVPTSWGNILPAHDLLLRNALKDKNNKHFIFLSESTIPLKSFNFIFKYLNEKLSYFHKGTDTNRENCRPVFKFINKNLIKKTSDWYILNRKHAQFLIENQEYNIWFKDAFQAAEHAYLTYLCAKGFESEISYETTTYVKWPKTKPARNPEFLDGISQQELNLLCSSHFLFARKFSENFNLTTRIQQTLI